jgi:hypothetical protein
MYSYPVMYIPYMKYTVYEGRESATLINIQYKHWGIQTDDSAKTTLEC